MRRLLKEVFKSLSKNKITVIGLSILIFLTTGIFTLLFSVKKVYDNKIQEYKTVSKMHDATVDLDINFAGITKNNLYQKLDEKVYLPLENATKTERKFKINSKYIQLKELGITGEKAEFYISAADLEREYQENKNIKNQDNKSFIFDLVNNNFWINSHIIKNFKLYENKNGEIVELKKQFILEKNTSVTLDKNYRFDEVVKIGTVSFKKNNWWGGESEETKEGIISINNLGINLETRESSFNIDKINQWNQDNILYKLSDEETAKLIGLKKENSYWIVEEKNKYLSDLFNWDDIVEYSWWSGTTFKPEGQTKSLAISNLNLDQQIVKESSSYFTFNSLLTQPNEKKIYSLKSEWVYSSTTGNKFIYHEYKLNENDDKNNKGIFKKYIEKLKNETPEEYKKIATISYWEKITYVIINGKEQSISQKLSREDLKTKIYLEKDLNKKETSIATILNWNNNNINYLSNKELDELSNFDIKDLTYLKLRQNVLELIRNDIYNKVKNNDKVNGVGERNFLTINSIDEKNGESKVYQFINAGISLNKFNQNQKQEVGLLFNEKQKESNLFIAQDPNLIKDKIHPLYVSKIVEAIFNGFIPDSNYIDVEIIYTTIYQTIGETKLENNLYNQKLVLLKAYGSEKNTKEYAIGKIEDNYILYSRVNENDNWTKESINDLDKLNFLQLSNLLVQKQWTLKANINEKNGWYKTNQEFKNNYIVPFIFRAPSSTLLKEIETSKTVTSLFNGIKRSIASSDLVKEGFVKLETINQLFTAMEDSFAKTKYYEIFTNGKNDQSLMQRMIFESLYLVTKQNGDRFLNDFINDFIEKIIDKINLLPEEKQQTYLLTEFNKFSTLFKVLGIDFWNNIIANNSIESLSQVISNHSEFLRGIQQIVNAFDFSNFLEKINSWYEKFWNKENVLKEKSFYYFGMADLIVPLIESMNFSQFKTGMESIVNQINFDKLLSTKIDENTKQYQGILFNSLIKKYANSSLKEKITDTLTKIFTELNGSQDVNQPYKNINEGLIGIIKILDKNLLLETINSSLEKVYFEGEKILEGDSKPTKVTFITNGLKNTNLLSAFISTLFKDSNSRNSLLSNIEKIFNLSGNSRFEGVNLFLVKIGNSVPEKEEGKIDLFDLQNLEILSYENFSNLIEKSKILKTKLTAEDFYGFNNDEISFIKEYLLLNDIEELKNKKVILDALNNFEEVLNFLIFKSFQKNENGEFVKKQDAKDEDFGIADFLYQLYLNPINKELALSKGKQAARKIVNPTILASEYSASVNSLSIFNFWIKLIAENPNLNKQELENIFNKISDLIKNNNSSIREKLLNKNLWENKSNFAGGLGIQPIGRGVTNSYLSTQEIFEKDDKGIYKDKTLSDFFNLEIFKTNPEFQKWFERNKFDFIENLALLAHSVEQHDDINFLTTTKQVFEKLISEEMSSTIKRNLLKNLSDKFSMQSKMFLSLGLSGPVSSSYLGVIFPIVSAWYTANPADNSGKYGAANLKFVLENRITDFSKIIEKFNDQDLFKNDIKQRFFNLFGESFYDYKLENHEIKGLSIDISAINWQKNKYLKDLNVFDINIGNLYDSLINASTIIREENNLLVLKDLRAYVAKISESFLDKNNKEIYLNDLPNNSLDMEKLIQNLDDKYLINVNGLKFIIVGIDSTADYLFPVIDEENLQVNTKQQALVYVNDYGFERIRESNRESAVKKYLLVEMKDSKKTKEFNQEINKYISNNYSATNTTKAFAASEFDFVNPERSLRVSTAYSLISTISKSNLYIVIILTTLVMISTIFITKRYISTRNQVLGILRAQGYSSIKIAISFTIFALLTSLVGGIAGYITGLSLQMPLMKLFSSYWTIPTTSLSFDWISFVFTIIIPFSMLSILIILVSLWTLRIKPIELMSGIVDINIGNVARKINKPFSKTGIKSKFVVSLATNSAWKLISLSISTILTVCISLFAIASWGVFKNSVNATYSKRNYKYKLDLLSPTREGGQYQTFSQNDLNDLLYVPLGDSSESNIESNNYFRPGQALVKGNSNLNGQIKNNAPHILSRSSLDIKVNAGLKVSPWEIVLNSMPDSQKARTLKLSNLAIQELENTQDLKIWENSYDSSLNFKYKGTKENPENFFEFIEENGNGKFWYMNWNNDKKAYQKELITTDKHRNEYRDFLVNAYKKIPTNDFFIAFGGINFNQKTNEKYSYAEVCVPKEIDSKNEDNSLKIYGYNSKSNFIKIVNKNGVNLIEKMEKFQDSKYLPISINYVYAKKHNLNIGDKLTFEVLNHIDRFKNKISKEENKKYEFKIVDFINTYINYELVTTQKVVNEITGMNQLSLDAFNGILSIDNKPEQTIESSGLYSTSGYWFGGDILRVETQSAEENANYFAQIFANSGSNLGTLKLNNFSDEMIEKLAFGSSKKPDNFSFNYEEIIKPEFYNKHSSTIRDALINFTNIYSKNIYETLSTKVEAKDIEMGFVNNISQTVSNITIAIIVFFFLVSIIILIMISNMIIAENEKNIAIFSILGYSNKEKILLFFGIYFPLIILSTIIAIPITISFITFFNAFLISSSAIALSLALVWWHVLIAIAIIFVVFILTSIIAWINLSKIKPIYLLKGK